MRGRLIVLSGLVVVAACSVHTSRSSQDTPTPVVTAPASGPAMAVPQQAGGKRQIVPGGRGNTTLLSPGILVGNTLYLSGQLGSAAARDSGVGPETRSAIRNAQNILRAAGYELSDVVSVTAYLANIADYQAFNTAYREFFTTDPRPTRTTVAVGALVNNAKIELTMVAVK
jgi:2-iminobutanoate/2-iminopropanoate deaminase